MVIREKTNTLADYIAVVVTFLMAIGAVFVFSASVNVSKQIDFQHFFDSSALRHIVFFPLACLVMYVISRIDYKRFDLTDSLSKSPTSYLLILSVVLLIAVLFPQIGTEVNQARRWLRVPVGSATISFQPSEFAKWMVVFFLVGVCCRYQKHDDLSWRQFLSVCLVIGVVVGLVIAEDFGTAGLISLLSFMIFIIAGVKWRYVLTPLPLAVIGFLVVLFRSPGRMRRILAFLNPEEWAGSVGYQANQSLIAIGSGGLFGKGLGGGISKYDYLPEDTTDFIFAIIGEELGFFGTAAVVGLFIIFVWLGVLVVVRCEDRFGQMLAGSIILTIGIQAAINIGVVTAVLPTKGIPLPFISAGGTSLLLSAAAAGVLLNIAKQTAKEQPREGQ